MSEAYILTRRRLLAGLGPMGLVSLAACAGIECRKRTVSFGPHCVPS